MIRILHVHDDTEQQRYVKRFLQATEQDIKVESAYSLAEVPIRLLNGAFDAVLSGFWIPEINEVELGVAVRMIKGIPFIMYKGRGREDVTTGTTRIRGGDIVNVEVDLGHIKALADKIVEAVTKNRENRRREVSLKIFRALSSGSDLQSSLGETLRIIQEGMGINAVGIRLQEGDDYPYYVFDGFHDKHILLENELCVTDLEGQLTRDDVGNPVLDCMCGNILRGRFDPSKPFFSEGGSFWTNSTTELLASTTFEDRLIRTRNTCQGEGYESVALIPIRDDSEVLGLLQLNDYRSSRFTPKAIRFLEELGKNIGETLGAINRRKEDLEELRLYREALRSAPIPTLVVDPDDLSILDASDSAVNMLGRPMERLIETTCYNALAGYDSVCDDHDEECPLVQMLERRGLISTVVNSRRGEKGEQRLIEESASPIRSPEGTIELALLTARVKTNEL
jgi:PAS domain-containing protein